MMLEGNDNRFLIITCFILFQFLTISAQIGKNCIKDDDCMPNQYCSTGYCNCVTGYVRNIEHCFKIQKYGEKCFFNDQCNDPRRLCRVSNNTDDPIKTKRCLCDQYHEWNDGLQECTHAQNLSAILSTMEENTKWQEAIEKKGATIFYVQVVAGIAVICVGGLLFGLCLIYGRCCRRKPKIPKPLSEKQAKTSKEVAGGQSTEGVYMPIFTDLT